MDTKLLKIIDEKKSFIEKHKREKGFEEEVVKKRKLVFVLEKNGGICPHCGERTVCLGLAKNADLAECTVCESERRLKKISYEKALEVAYELTLKEPVTPLPVF